MASQAVSALAARATAALKGKPPIGGSIYGNFYADGGVLISANNTVSVLDSAPNHPVGCTISLSLAELADLEAGASVEWAVVWGKVKIEGDEDLAKRFGEIVKGAA